MRVAKRPGMKHPKHPLALPLVLALAPLSGCATVSPPPAVMALGGASQGPAHATSVTAFGGAAGGVFINGSLGGGVRVAHRISDTVEVGVDGMAGAVVDPSEERVAPRVLAAGRAHLQVNPGASEHVALTFGLGAGASDNRLAYGTVDAGARVSRRWANGVFEPYVGGVLALSVPAATPAAAVRDPENDRRMLATMYFGVDAGVALHPTERLDVALDLLFLGGYSAANTAVIMTPSLGVRYAFGGEVRRR
jgi:hypothetical protein